MTRATDGDGQLLNDRAQAILKLAAHASELSDPEADRMFLNRAVNIAEATNPDGTINLDVLTTENRKAFIAAWGKSARRRDALTAADGSTEPPLPTTAPE